MSREYKNIEEFQDFNSMHLEVEDIFDFDEKEMENMKKQMIEENRAILMRAKIIQNIEESQRLLENEDIKYVLENVESEKTEWIINCFQIKTFEQFQYLCEDENVRNILEFTELKKLNCFAERFQIEILEKFVDIFKDKNIGDALRYAKLENFEYTLNLFQIKTLEQFQSFCANDNFVNILIASKLENVKYVIEGKFKITAEQLLEYLDDHNFFSFLTSADPEVVEYMSKFFGLADFEQFKKFYVVNFGSINIENFEFIANCFSIKTIEQFYELYKNNNIMDALVYAKTENLKYLFDAFHIETPQQFLKMCKNENVTESLDKARIENIKYLIENNIVNADNFFHLEFDAINLISELVDIKQENEQENIFFKELMNKYPKSASSAISVIFGSKQKDEVEDIDIMKHQKDVFDVLDKLGNITPFVFDKFRKLNAEEREKYAEEIKLMKKEIWKNKPIDFKGSPDEMAELIYIIYKPLYSDYQETKEYMSELTDHTEHLKDYEFPEDGYDIEIENKTEKILKKESELDFENIDSIFEIIKDSAKETEQEKQEGNIQEISVILNNIAKATPILKDPEMSKIINLFKNEDFYNFTKEKISQYDINGLYDFLFGVKEAIEKTFEENAKNNIKNFLEQNPKSLEIIENTLENYQEPFLKALGNDFQEDEICSDDYWDNLDIEKISNLLAVFTKEKIIGNFEKRINKELNKIEDKERISHTRRKQKEKVKMKAYISKNIASFFAKASVGICTAENIELFNRENHFHINLIEKRNDGDEIMRCNAQAYIIDEGNGEKSLLLRGINPNSDFLYEVDVGSLCEEIIKVGKQFAEDNNFKDVFLSEQTGESKSGREEQYSLSDRDSVVKYLSDKFLKENNKKALKFNIYDDLEISYVYKI